MDSNRNGRIFSLLLSGKAAFYWKKVTRDLIKFYNIFFCFLIPLIFDSHSSTTHLKSQFQLSPIKH
jgi:hypothetical protein